MSGVDRLSAPARAAMRRADDTATKLIVANRTGGRLNVDALSRGLAELPPTEAAAARQAVEAQLTPVQRGEVAARSGKAPPDVAGTVADVAQLTLDIVGIFEPTPFADGANTIISAVRGDGVGALLSAAGMLPYVGDLAKAGKLGRWAKTVSHAVELAATSSTAYKALAPGLRKLQAAIDCIPDSIMRHLPDRVQRGLRGMKSQLDNVLSPIRRQIDGALGAAANRLGVPRARLNAIQSMPRGSRPAVETYMTAGQRAAHLAQFDAGVVRVTSRTSLSKYGTLGPQGGFVTSLTDFRAIVRESRGDLRVVERRLSLDPGTLSNKDTVIALVDRKDAAGLRLPTGNEGGANTQWVPGGYTSNNTVEAVMDFGKGVPYQEIKLR